MLEAIGVRPGWKLRAALLDEALLEADVLCAGVSIARGDRAADARVAALEGDLTKLEAHHAAELGAEEPVLPESGNALDLQSGAESQARFVYGHARVPGADSVERGGGENSWPVGDEIVGDAVGVVADHDLKVEKFAEPFGGGPGFAGEAEGGGWQVAPMWRRGERDGLEIGCVRSADEVQRRRTAEGHQTPIERVEGPGTVELQAAGRADGGGLDLDRVERLDGVNLDAREPRGGRRGWGMHQRILAVKQDGPDGQIGEREKSFKSRDIYVDNTWLCGILTLVKKYASAMPGRFAF